jgi:CubicO group peptidase (beta-lactamase class C family)
MKPESPDTALPLTAPLSGNDRVIADLLAALNSNRRQPILDFLNAHLAWPSSDRTGIDTHADWLMSFSRLSQGLDVREVKPMDAANLTQTWVVNDRLYSAVHECTLRFDAANEGKILDINLTAGEMQPVVTSQADALAHIQQLCERGARAEVFSGTVLVARGADVLFEFACGAANKRYDAPNNLDTRFNLGSANKMFTAIAVAQLVERGRLNFTDTIDRYIDDTWLQASVTRRITVHHLLSHTSGLGSYFNDAFFNGSRARFRAIDDFKPLVRDEQPDFEPGERFGYSNTGMLLAGVIVERVSSKSYYDYIREAIYQPAGMHDTDSYDIDAPVPNLAMGYIPLVDANSDRWDGWRENIFEHVAKGGPAGGGFSTARDLHRFACSLLSGELVGATMREALWTDHSGVGYGYGFETMQTPKGTVVAHGGGFAGVSASFEMTLDTGDVAIVLSNYDEGTFGLSRCIRHALQQIAQ